MQILKENSNIGAFDLIKKTLSVIICLCDFQKNEANSALAYLNEVTKGILTMMIELLIDHLMDYNKKVSEPDGPNSQKNASEALIKLKSSRNGG